MKKRINIQIPLGIIFLLLQIYKVISDVIGDKFAANFSNLKDIIQYFIFGLAGILAIIFELIRRKR